MNHFVAQLFVIAILSLFAVCCLIRLAQTYRKARRDIRLFANIAEGTHENGNVSKKSAAAIATRFLFFKIGADVDHWIVSSAVNEKCLGVCTDEAAAAEAPINIYLLGPGTGTQKITVGAGGVALGDALMSDGAGKAITLTPGAGHYELGTAVQAGAAGEIIEFTPCYPIHRPT